MLLNRAWSKQTSCSTSVEVSAAGMRLVISGGFKSPARLLLLVLLGGRGGRGGRAWRITLALTGLDKTGWQLTQACIDEAEISTRHWLSTARMGL